MYNHVSRCCCGGRGGIRTHGSIAATPDFESGAFDQLSHPSIASKMRKRKIAEIVGFAILGNTMELLSVRHGLPS
jgi:hypothetical protein